MLNINSLLETAAKKKASDLHLAVGKPPIIRLDGELQELNAPILKDEEVKRLVSSLLTKPQQEEFLRRRELDISYALPGVCRFRVNIHWEKGNVGLVARIVPEKIPTMKDVLMPEVVYNLTRLKQGLILVTGPTGCGKSTSLAAMIDLINSERGVHIVTLEDPIEFVFTPNKALIRQREYGKDFLSFAEALKRVVRQDPNVIMVGEMRDLETIAAALTVAETGHLVLATLHTNNASQTIDRIIDVFPPYQQDQIRLQVSMELRAVISQQLLPKNGGGRLAAREILLNTPAVANLIRENKIPQIKTVIQTSADEGMLTLEQDIRRLLKEGLIAEQTAETYLGTLLR